MDKLTENIFQPGDHGSTFGGNPVACAGAVEVLKQTANTDFLSAVRSKAEYLYKGVSDLPNITGISGIGLMFGLSLENSITAAEAAKKCVEKGLLILTAKAKLRIMPPLTISREEIDMGISILRSCLQGLRKI